jgi:hypothetical protein
MSRFVVGIDLGTTNCAVGYVDTEVSSPGANSIETFAIAQVVAAGEVEARATLPSFLLLPGPHEVKPEAISLPWEPAPDTAVGLFARDRGAELPHRTVGSAKSWLSYSAVDRTAPLLPWRASDEEPSEGERRVSPVQASARYLAHIRAAWNSSMPVPLEEQEVLLTVPASFDAVARELTALAAREAGLTHVTLIEEPQAAFYSWLAASGEHWRHRLRAGDVVVVCDVGGGTSDFTLIAVSDDGSGNLELERIAVGDHILLGGDNMDLALAHRVGETFAATGKQLKPAQYRALVHASRSAKEQLLAAGAPDTVPISVLGGGSKVIGGALRAEIACGEAHQLLLDGFFPRVPFDERPRQRRALGLRELGLPYASDPGVTRHLAEFLGRHSRRPTAVLYNGGVMKGELLRQRVNEVLASWFDGVALTELAGTHLDLAVAHGAAYYGLVRRGRGIRIRGGTARSYYIGVESAAPAIPGFSAPIKALCIAPFGMEEGSAAELAVEELGLVTGEPTVFRFFASSTRKSDRPGSVVDPGEAELAELAPVETHLPRDATGTVGDLVPVTLSAQVTEVGTLELWAVARDGRGRWKLEYSLREG